MLIPHKSQQCSSHKYNTETVMLTHSLHRCESQGETQVQTPHLLCANTWRCCQGGSGGASQTATWPGGPTTEDCGVPRGRRLLPPGVPVSKCQLPLMPAPSWMSLTGTLEHSNRQVQTSPLNLNYLNPYVTPLTFIKLLWNSAVLTMCEAIGNQSQIVNCTINVFFILTISNCFQRERYRTSSLREVQQQYL